MAVTGRYIRSDLSGGIGSESTLKPANSFAVDVSGYLQTYKHTSFGDYEGRVRAGWAIQNLWAKIRLHRRRKFTFIFTYHFQIRCWL